VAELERGVDPLLDEAVAGRQPEADPLAGPDDQALDLGMQLGRAPQVVLDGRHVCGIGSGGRGPPAEHPSPE